MIKRLKDAYLRHVERQENIQKSLNEINWANCFHDSIRGYKKIEDLNLNIGRWAGGYPFFYCLFRVLNQPRTLNVLEMGLGESSKFISIYLSSYSKKSKHIILEHNIEWKEHYLRLNRLTNNSEVLLSELEVIDNEPCSYEEIKNIDGNDFNVFVVDGPIGTKTHSRVDICKVIDDFKQNKSFVILIDDTNRQGEKNTLDNAFQILREKNIEFFTKDINGVKQCTLITSSDNRFLTSI